MPEQLPILDAGSAEWLMQAHKASLNSKFCTMPQKYFDVLTAWGYVDGTPTAVKLTGKGLSKVVSDQQLDKKRKN